MFREVMRKEIPGRCLIKANAPWAFLRECSGVLPGLVPKGRQNELKENPAAGSGIIPVLEKAQGA